MERMFQTNTAFNNSGSSDINNWNVSRVTNFLAMFDAASSFNQPLGNWTFTTTGSVSISMNGMFNGASSFNQDIGSWNTIRVTNMNAMFQGNGMKFNNGGSDSIKNWNTSRVTSISILFQNQPIFNQPINTQSVTVNGLTYTAWNTSLVTTMSSIFGGESLKSFNQDISGWNTANVTIMSYAFRNAVNFNQNISGWNTAKVTDMSSMFYNASVFNQNLGSWNVSLVTSFNDIVFGGFMEGSGLSTVNYDALLNGWASRSVLPSKSVNFGAVQYSASSVSSRSTLTSAPNLWTIIDGGLAA
jgi:surface protein